MKLREVFYKRLDTILGETKADRIIVAFSGGKDSTVLLSLTLEVCMEKGIPLALLHGDTLVENPLIRDYCDRFLNTLSNWAGRSGISIEVLRVEPKQDMTFWVNVIGKGYPMPSFRFRWCQKHLKIKPAERILKKERGIMLVGMRKSESVERKNSLEKRLDDMELEENGVRVFAPIHDWKDEDVWGILSSDTPPWGGTYAELIALYKEARGECPLIPDPNFKGNGCGSRFGCWTCSVVREDKTMKNLAIRNKRLMKLAGFRDWLVEFCSDPENRTGFTRKGKFIGGGKGMLTFKAREKVLDALLELQSDVSMELIKPWEIDIIQRVWEEDKRRFPQLLETSVVVSL